MEVSAKYYFNACTDIFFRIVCTMHSLYLQIYFPGNSSLREDKKKTTRLEVIF